jgi:hypothetical protein
LSPRGGAAGSADGGSRALLAVAVARGLMVTATYNKRRVKLAPHALFTRHGELYLDALTIEQDGAPPTSRRLGTFKLSGLTGTMATAMRFDPFSEFDRNDAKYSESLIAVVPAGGVVEERRRRLA